MLDSDVPNADEKLFVEFRVYKGEDERFKGQTFVKIMSPGNQLNIIDRPMRESDKSRFVRQWLHYLGQQTGGMPDIGLELGVWANERPDDITANQLDELRILKFQTVEQIATATDAQLQRVGMGGLGLREKARMYLANRNKQAATSEISELKKQLVDMAALIADLSAKRGPGRPKADAA